MNKEQIPTKTIERFWSLVDKRNSDECWEWQGADTGRGYGSFSVKNLCSRAHRFSWIIHNDIIPPHESYHGICVLHKCDNKKCVNPNHLFLGTQADNMKDMANKGRGNGKATAKLTPEQVLEIKAILASPRHWPSTLRQIAKDYGVSHNTIWLIERGLSWRNS